VGEEVPELLEEVTLALVDSEQLRDLPGDDGQGQADDESFEHRFGDEPGEKAEFEQPGEDRDDAGDQR